MKRRVLIGLALAISLARPGGAKAQVIDHSNPSANNDDLVANQSYEWGPIFLGGVCRLTDKGSGETGSIFARERVNISQFQNSFEFQILSGGPEDTSDGSGNCSDGLTFTIQNDALDALGGSGVSLGYKGAFPHSIAIKLDHYQNAWGDKPDPSASCTGLYVNGEEPIGGIDLLKDNVNLRSQHPFRVDMRYDGKVLSVRIADLNTNAFSLQHYSIDIPATIGSRTAWVGFTASTGLGTSAQDLHKWYFASPPLDSRLGARSGHGALIAKRGTAVPSGATVAAWPTVTHHPAHATALLSVGTENRIVQAR